MPGGERLSLSPNRCLERRELRSRRKRATGSNVKKEHMRRRLAIVIQVQILREKEKIIVDVLLYFMNGYVKIIMYWCFSTRKSIKNYYTVSEISVITTPSTIY